jgi:peptide/nickel transport system substrate-binding protein
MEWPTIPDPATASAALLSGEVDWYEQVQPDLVPGFRQNPDLVVGDANPAGFNGILRFNHLHPPFNNPAIRRAVLMAVNQHDYMQALVGDDPGSRGCQAMFPCGTPYGQEIGKSAMLGDLDKAKAALKAAGYNGEKVVIISPADVPTIAPMGDVTHDLLTRLGMNSELIAVDWATLTTKRAVREPVEKGGWSIFHTWAPSTIIGTPVEHFPMRGLGEKGWAGWYGDEKMEALTRDWAAASTDADQTRIAGEIHARAMEMVPFILCGQFHIRTAYRKYLTGVVSGGAAYMWNVRRV